MTTKEFIEGIANGTFSKNDIITLSETFPDKKDLAWDLWMADKECQESTGKPQISDEAQICRISRAIDIICNEYQVNIFSDNDSHTVPAPIKIPEKMDTDLFRAFLNVAIQKGIIEKNNGTIKFKKGNALLAYACGVIFCGDHIETDKITKDFVIKRGYNGDFPEKQLKEFFGIDRLSQSRSQIIGKLPRGYREIEDLLSKSENLVNRA